MPKKKKGGRKKKIMTGDRKLEYADENNGQVYGIVEKALGDRFFNVNCLDNQQRRCKARKKRIRIKIGDVVVVSLRDFEKEKGDIIYKYELREIKTLQKEGFLPSSNNIGNSFDKNDSDDDIGFDFEDI